MGVLRIERRGIPHSTLQTLAKDAYHFLRRASWTRLTIAFFLGYLAINFLFAAILWFGDAHILAAGPSFWDRFFFSVQTMATIGYGHMAPGDDLSNTVVTVESFVGLFYTALLTGVVFGKFATPSAKVLFSKNALVTHEGGVPTLMFRCANARATAIVEAHIRVAWTRDEVLPGGENMRRIYDLQLRRDSSPVFALSWTVSHKIDETSPLWGRTAEDLAAEGAAVIITLTGIDDSLAASVHTRHAYAAEDIVFGERFVDIMSRDPDGTRFVDFARFHDTEPL
jgi:inward rectifier potassium channel